MDSNPDEALEPRTPRYTRDSPAFQEARPQTAIVVDDRQSGFKPGRKTRKDNSGTSQAEAGSQSSGGNTSRSGSTTEVNIVIDAPPSDSVRGSPEPEPEQPSSVKRRKTDSVSHTLQ